MGVWEVAVHVAEVALGIVLLYVAFFLYEDTEGRLQDALTDIWLRVFAGNPNSVFTRLVDETARFSLRILDRLFGARLLSWQAIAVSIALATASCLTLQGPSVYDPGDAPSGATAVIYFVAVIVAVSALIPAVLKGRWANWIPTLGTGLGVATMLVALHYEMEDLTGTALLGSAFLAALAAALLLDFLWLVLCRRATAWATHRPGILPNLATLLAGLGVLLGTILFLPVREDQQTDLILAAFFSDSIISVLAAYFQVSLAGTRLFIVVVATLQLVVVVLLFVNRLVWPILSRVVYSAERHQLVKKRKLLGTMGGALLAHGLFGASWILTLLKVTGLG